MTPSEFRDLARTIAGPQWRSKLGPMIGKKKWMVWAYAHGRHEVPETVQKLLLELAKSAD